MDDQIAAYWGSKETMEATPALCDCHHFTDWDTVVPIDHGYDESKPESELTLEDVRKAAEFRGERAFRIKCRRATGPASSNSAVHSGTNLTQARAWCSKAGTGARL
jgi:hypothetical protein